LCLGDLLQWLSDFLIGRKQKSVIGNDTSSWCDVKSGVPQGSVLGPVLFATDVSDLPQVVESLIAIFAAIRKILTPWWTNNLNFISTHICCFQGKSDFGYHQ